MLTMNIFDDQFRKEGRPQLLSWYNDEKVRKLAKALDELKIPHPPVTGKTGGIDWHRFLIRLGAEARVRNIRCARLLWKEMRGELGHE